MSATPSKLTIIFAGEDFAVNLLDDTTVQVRVRAMPVRHLGRLLQLADHEAELLEFVCVTPDGTGLPEDRKNWAPPPAGWADNLSDASHAQLYEAAKRLNFSRAASWAERQIAAKQFSGELALKAEQAIMPIMEKVIGLLGSLSKSPALPAVPSTPS